MSETKITLTIMPSGNQRDDVTVADFIKQISGLHRALTQTEASISGGAGTLAEFKVVDLSHNSPATVVIEAFPLDHGRDPGVVVNTLFSSLIDIRSGGEVAPILGRGVFDAIKEVVAPIGHHVQSANIRVGDADITIDLEMKQAVERCIGADEFSSGTLDGMLEGINIHNRKNVFTLYPIIGPKRVSCWFTDDKLANARDALGRYVNVMGEMKYRWREKHPYEIRVADIEVLPDEDDLPMASDLLGIAPNATGGISAEAFVRNLRNEWV